MLRCNLRKWKPLSGVDWEILLHTRFFTCKPQIRNQISDSPLLPSREEQESGRKSREAIAPSDVALRAEVRSYSRSPVNDANQRLYNRSVSAKEIVLDGMGSPPWGSRETTLRALMSDHPKIYHANGRRQIDWESPLSPDFGQTQQWCQAFPSPVRIQVARSES